MAGGPGVISLFLSEQHAIIMNSGSPCLPTTLFSDYSKLQQCRKIAFYNHMIIICMLRNWLVTSRVSNLSHSHVSLSDHGISLNGRRRSEVVSLSWSRDLPLRDPSCQTQLLLLNKDCLYIVVCKSVGSLDHTLCTCFWIYLPLFLAELVCLYIEEEMGSFGMNFKISSV